MAKAQDTFKELLKCSVAPRLRECGLKGSGQNYAIKSLTHWALIGFQKSVFSDADELKFTINLYVVPKERWEAERTERSYLPTNPTANVHWPVGWVKRIGYLLPKGQDHWWTLDANTDIKDLADEIVEVICNTAVPTMQEKIESA
jgi:hypothetical protein